VVVARALGTAGAGVFFAGTALFNILNVAGRLGADTGMVRRMSRLEALGAGP
jgi:O-antigen/teichoic acid export membrane protein